MRKLAWDSNGWSDYVYWRREASALVQRQDRKTLKRIKKVIEDVMRNPFDGIGKPEPLKENLSGYWSRRIDEANRLVYKVEKNYIIVISCRYHY